MFLQVLERIRVTLALIGRIVPWVGLAMLPWYQAQASEVEEATARMQLTYNWQYHPAYQAAYSGPNSIVSNGEKHASCVISAWNAWHLSWVNSALLLTSSTAEAAKSQQCTKRSALAASRGNTVLPVPQPTSSSVAAHPCHKRHVMPCHGGGGGGGGRGRVLQ